jgi:hypothetical protein
MAIKEKVSDEQLEILQGKPYDIYRWLCAYPGCCNACQVRKYTPHYPERVVELLKRDIRLLYPGEYLTVPVVRGIPQPRKEVIILHQNLYVWMRSQPHWVIDGCHFRMCSRHWPIYQKRKIQIEVLSLQDRFVLFKKDAVDLPKYSIIEKIESRWNTQQQRSRHSS